MTEVPIDDFGVQLLRDRRASYPVAGDDCFVVCSRPDGSEPVNPDSLSSFVHRQATKLGLRLEGRNPLRHLAGTELIAGGIDARSAAEHLGHSDPALTLRRYAHARVERRRSAATLLAGVQQQATGSSTGGQAAVTHWNRHATPVEEGVAVNGPVPVQTSRRKHQRSSHDAGDH